VSYLVKVTVQRMQTARGRFPNCLDCARSLFERFHCYPSPQLIRQSCHRLMPSVLVRLGELRGLIYRAERGRRGCPQTFIHFLGEPAQLACDPQGRQLYILGGRYRVTSRGIEG
jgi:hypothetical protein